MMMVIGAVNVFVMLPGDNSGPSLTFAFCDRTKTKRAGPAFELVGPHFRYVIQLAGTTGLEPATSAVTDRGGQ